MIPPVAAETPTPVPPASPAWRALLENALTRRLDPVGFRRNAPPDDFSDWKESAEFSVWFSVYGFVVLYCVPTEKASALFPDENVMKLARELAETARTKNRLWDAYAVLAFASEPEGEAAARVRVFEQGKAVARRHALWPTGDAALETSWAGRLDRITCCAVPAASATHGKLAPTLADLPAWLREIEARLAARATDIEVLASLETLVAGDQSLEKEGAK